MISIILPVYNQYSSLVKVIKAFEMQTINLEQCEFIIVDDGSTDNLKSLSFIEGISKSKYKIVHQHNKGRAAARNRGIIESKGELLIFCDADRFPDPDFIRQHIQFHQRGFDIVIGASYDYFGKENNMEVAVDWNEIAKFSRLPLYFKKVASLYDEKGETLSSISWLSFLVGNASVKRSAITEVGGFDESFVEWGFEHFDLAYRLHCLKYNFSLNVNAINYHIPHPREEGFYKQAILTNAKKFCEKHSKVCEDTLVDFVAGSISTDVAEKKIYTGEDRSG